MAIAITGFVLFVFGLGLVVWVKHDEKKDRKNHA